MGIQDRDYYRNEGPSVLDSLLPSGLVCRWLIGINVAVFLVQVLSRGAEQNSAGWVDQWFQLDVHKVEHGEVWRLLTFAFLHDGITHIFFNMLFLWWFGSDVEQLYGRREFLAIYLISAFLGGVAYEIWGLIQTSPVGPCIGASGAVTTMLILCALHYPRRIIHLFAILPVPIWLFAVFCVGADVYGLFHKTHIAVVVHLAGAVFAVAYYKWQRSLSEIVSGLMWWRNRGSRMRLRLFQPDPEREEPVAVSASSSASSSSMAPATAVVDEHLEAKLDAVLAKIAKSGKESLTKQEQEILQRAAQMYKRRRT